MHNISNMAIFTDIHWGAKGNSEQHNQDCTDYVDWFIAYVKANDIDAVAFLGDWNENRSSLNILTMTYSHLSAKKLNELGIPIFFVLGNHDLYRRHTREVHSIITFSEFTNFQIIETPTVIKNTHGDFLMVPFMFHDEYPSLNVYGDINVWMGHFEFQGFEISGGGCLMKHGPKSTDFSGPDFILSGHFHKRQAKEGSNVVYVGNTFPTNFGDAGDFHRGLSVFNFDNNSIQFEDWTDCPKYVKTTLSDVLSSKTNIPMHARVRCIADIPISFEESVYLKQKFTEQYTLREFTLEESHEIKQALIEPTEVIDVDTENSDVNQLVRHMLQSINSDHINNDILLQEYNKL